ncbi:ATP-dependent RNA helicase dbp7 [Varicellaria rhodocarpa]|nr:ATP-dependent RNA helicase dbp7 [Varicellaria rhodocarpa]
MAEDALLMNFDLGDEALSIKPIYKGGHWKARLNAKKGAQYRHKKFHSDGLPTAEVSKDTNGAGNEELESTAERPPKRQKVVDNQSSRSRQGITTNGPKEVVSSLFSYNPTSKISAKAQTEDTAITEPSNAPLIDGLDTFTSLGLSTTLATHLLTKLNLKAPTAIQKSAITQLIKDDSDAFIQAETGSGKTLAYLLPIVQRIMELSKKTSDAVTQEGDGQVHRDSGLFAIILAPTRELCKQISIVLDGLLRCAHWIVASTVIGGDKKKSEKARLRKGLNILVATPGRLADHLNNTEALDVSNVRWLVMDEGDRLMELGFEEEIRGIVSKLEERSKATKNSPIPGLPNLRTTVLCSATMKMNVQRLGEISLKDAVHIKADPKDSTAVAAEKEQEQDSFSVPAQLKQSYIIVPPKQRLVSLAALLKRTFARKGSVMKAIVFLSCADSVDFHFEAFARKTEPIESAKSKISEENASTDTTPTTSTSTPNLSTITSTSLLTSPLNPGLTLHKLHGSLPQPVRTATLSSFTHTSTPSVLLCTDVASRGLDLPNIDLVVEYDPPFSSDDHLHRVGRTARAGRDGRAVIFLMPGSEEGYVEILKAGYRDGVGRGLVRSEAAETLRKGFGAETPGNNNSRKTGSGNRDWEEKATEWQLDVEKWVIDDKHAGDMARKAFISHVRAYATHVAKERPMFDVKGLHLGHLAKAFALRERPGNMGRGTTIDTKPSSRNRSTRQSGASKSGAGEKVATGKAQRRDGDLDSPSTDAQEAAKKMRKKMREHMAGVNEFNIG